MKTKFILITQQERVIIKQNYLDLDGHLLNPSYPNNNFEKNF